MPDRKNRCEDGEDGDADYSNEPKEGVSWCMEIVRDVDVHREYTWGNESNPTGFVYNVVNLPITIRLA